MRRIAVLYRYEEKSQPYLTALRAAGDLSPHSVTPDLPVPSLDGFAGILLTGGTDVDPALYGEESGPKTETPDRDRDRLELALLRQALDRDLPVLAVCRGMQLFNVFHGGTLLQHIEGHAVRSQTPDLPVHPVIVAANTRLDEIVGPWRGRGRLAVNSRHHQAVGRLGDGLVVSARSTPDGIVEGLERPDRRFALAVQWHPEEQIRLAPLQLELFRAFARAVA